MPSACAAAIVAIALAVPAAAADNDGNYAVWGAGGASCNQYNKLRLEGEDKMFRSYISGYFTHYNLATPDTINIAGSMDMLEVLGMIDEICSDSPVIGFDNAMAVLVEKLHPQRQRRGGGRGR